MPILVLHRKNSRLAVSVEKGYKKKIRITSVDRTTNYGEADTLEEALKELGKFKFTIDPINLAILGLCFMV
jgi:hypothetical protein